MTAIDLATLASELGWREGELARRYRCANDPDFKRLLELTTMLLDRLELAEDADELS